MDLQEFVTQALDQIRNGIHQHHLNAYQHHIRASSDHAGVQDLTDRRRGDVLFDVAVTITDEKAHDGKGQIRVFGALSAAGGASTASRHETVSRIQFTVLSEANQAPRGSVR